MEGGQYARYKNEHSDHHNKINLYQYRLQEKKFVNRLEDANKSLKLFIKHRSLKWLSSLQNRLYESNVDLPLLCTVRPRGWSKHFSAFISEFKQCPSQLKSHTLLSSSVAFHSPIKTFCSVPEFPQVQDESKAEPARYPSILCTSDVSQVTNSMMSGHPRGFSSDVGAGKPVSVPSWRVIHCECCGIPPLWIGFCSRLGQPS